MQISGEFPGTRDAETIFQASERLARRVLARRAGILPLTGGVDIFITLSSFTIIIRLLVFITSLQPALAVAHLKSSIIIVVLASWVGSE